ncbi:hypothetical protein BGX21_000853 [Mortierella sp. AD011]|nr:hypothetical protein BGX20_008102 [Mortierella sp. AD010]KAF9401726.1 hypothetical protein BGX21_000853 [Mortierella sp. AD011]
MYGITISRNNTHDFGRVMAMLENLEIFDSSLSDLPEAPEQFKNMKSLILSLEANISLETQISWIAKHPQLKYLGWFPVLSFDNRAMDDLAHRAATGAWPNLQSLHLRSTASDKQVSCLIKGMDQGTLDLRLEKGLSQLGTLKRLKKFQFYDTPQQMSSDEVDWMIETWKYLQLVNGMLNEDYEETDRLRERIYSAGIVAF